MAWLTNPGGGKTNWWAGNGSDPVRPLGDPTLGAFYTPGQEGSNPTAFWRQVGQMFSGGDTNFEDFWNKNYDRYMPRYLQDAEKSQNKNLTFDQWLTGDMGNEIAAQYQLQSPAARGIDRRLYDPGRFDTSY